MSEILTYRVVRGTTQWEVRRDGHDGALADFERKEAAIAWAESEARKIGMGRVVVEDGAGAVEREQDFIDAAVRDELHLPR